MTNDAISVNVSLNDNVLYKMRSLDVSYYDDINLQEAVDTLYASALMLMAVLDLNEAGKLTGKVLSSALVDAYKIKLMVTLDEV